MRRPPVPGMMGVVWTVIGGLGGSLVGVGALITFSSRDYALGVPVLVVGLAILALWYVNYFRG